MSSLEFEVQHEPGADIIYELAHRLYPSVMEPFREMISNAVDEESHMVRIVVAPTEIIIEDWGKGIKDFWAFTKYGEATKAKLNSSLIGEKGLGKLSALRLGPLVRYQSNNGEIDIEFYMAAKGYTKPEIRGVGKILDHRGTKIIVPNPQRMPVAEDLSKYLTRAFGLRIAKGLEIIIDEKSLHSKVMPEEHFLFRLKGGIDVKGNLQREPRGKGTADVYIKHVFVTSAIVDPDRAFDGWVNCDELKPTTNRNDIVKDAPYDDIYRDFMEHLREYVSSRFPKRGDEIGREEVLLGQELSRLLKSYLKDMKLLPEGSMLLGRGDEADGSLGERSRRKKKVPQEEPEKEVPPYVKLHVSTQTNKPIRRHRKTDYGLIWIKQDAGNDQEPIFFVEPNMVVENRTNDLYKFALKSKPGLGPKSLRILPYLGRVAASINPESKNWNVKEFNLETDRAIRYFLRQKKLV